jgi:hypothetical protein
MIVRFKKYSYVLFVKCGSESISGPHFLYNDATVATCRWREPLEKCGQNVVKFGGFKKKDLVKCLKISSLQSLVVPRAGALTIRLNQLNVK